MTIPSTTILSTTILLLLVMDPLGNIPLFISVLKNVEERRRLRATLRELLIALAILLVLLLGGNPILGALRISEASLRISGGIVLFLIALKMIFSSMDEPLVGGKHEDPFIVPLAMPAVAGPSAMATVLILSSQEPDRLGEWAVALLMAWAVTAGVLLAGTRVSRILGRRGLVAMHRLMGMILTTISVEMLLAGVKGFIGTCPGGM